MAISVNFLTSRCVWDEAHPGNSTAQVLQSGCDDADVKSLAPSAMHSAQSLL
jgi:hypothetical protein